MRELRARLDEAHAEAERLVQQAQPETAAGGAERVPPRGWESPHRPAPSELGGLLALLDSMRDAVPAELSRQLATALRDLLLALRALIDWYLERLGEPARRRSEVEVEDIPLD